MEDADANAMRNQRFLKAQERIQAINAETASAARLIITAYNDLCGINRPGIEHGNVLMNCTSSILLATNRLKRAIKLYESEGAPELRDEIKTHFEQRRQETRYLRCVSTRREMDENDGE